MQSLFVKFYLLLVLVRVVLSLALIISSARFAPLSAQGRVKRGEVNDCINTKFGLVLRMLLRPQTGNNHSKKPVRIMYFDTALSIINQKKT
jgi:hypothetical protein